MQIAAIAYAPKQGDAVDVILCDLARDLRGRGVHLAGAIQWNVARVSHSRCDMELEDLATGRRIDASDKKRAANGCRLDAWALEDAAGLVAASIVPGIGLAIFNRFGKQEVAGQGFRAAIETAIAAELPVLLSVNETYRAAFDAFTGGEARVLPADRAAVAAWCDAILKDRAA